MWKEAVPRAEGGEVDASLPCGRHARRQAVKHVSQQLLLVHHAEVVDDAGELCHSGGGRVAAGHQVPQQGEEEGEGDARVHTAEPSAQLARCDVARALLVNDVE